MAKIHQESITVKFSKLVKDNETALDSIIQQELISALEQVTQELAGDSIIVEIIQD